MIIAVYRLFVNLRIFELTRLLGQSILREPNNPNNQEKWKVAISSDRDSPIYDLKFFWQTAFIDLCLTDK